MGRWLQFFIFMGAMNGFRFQFNGTVMNVMVQQFVLEVLDHF